MNLAMRAWQLLVSTAAVLTLGVSIAGAQTAKGTTYPIDLPAALRLAGAQNLDIQIAREAVKEAEAARISAIEQFFPWLNTGIVYHRRDGLAQAVPGGTISHTRFDSYQPGGTITAQTVLGDAIYNSLAAKQLEHASDDALEAQRQDALLSAAQAYFDLANAEALVDVAGQALETSQSYQRQLHEAVAIGVAFKGDELRVQTQTKVYEIGVRQAHERQRVAAARLAQILHLDPAMELVAQDSGLAALHLFEESAAQQTLVDRALAARPELHQEEALVSAARDAETGAEYGPLIPSVGAQVFAGGLGGGHIDQPSTFGAMEDYIVGLSWRVGPGGLFDVGRIDAAKARLATAQLVNAKLRDGVIADVVESFTRVQSLADQITLAKQNLGAADETLRLTRERKHYGVGIVLEDIQAQQALNQARADYFTTIAEYDKAQYALNKAVGGSDKIPGDE